MLIVIAVVAALLWLIVVSVLALAYIAGLAFYAFAHLVAWTAGRWRS